MVPLRLGHRGLQLVKPPKIFRDSPVKTLLHHVHNNDYGKRCWEDRNVAYNELGGGGFTFDSFHVAAVATIAAPGPRPFFVNIDGHGGVQIHWKRTKPIEFPT